MQLEIIHTFDALRADEWNNLLNHSASDVPFLRYEYLNTWWNTRGGGEWKTGELYIILGRQDQTGELLGIAPFFLTTNLQGEQSLMLLGSIEISDYLDIIARQEDLAAFVEAIFEHLAVDQPAGWQALDLYNLLENSSTLACLENAAARRGWQYAREDLQHCPSIALPGDFEQYLAEQVEKKQRHEIRRKMRRAEAFEKPVRWYIVQDEDKLDEETEAFLHLMAQDEEKQRFLTDVMRTQMKLAVHAAFRGGWLQLAFLEVDGKKAAGYLNFDYGNHIWVYNSGLDYGFRELSPGWVLLGHLLQWANENGRQQFDFMRGDEDYKYRFGAVDRRVVRATVRREWG